MRQRRHHYAIFVQVGTTRTRNFATLGPLYYGRRLLSRSRVATLNPINFNLPAPGRHHTYTSTVFAECYVFNKQLQRPGFCGCRRPGSEFHQLTTAYLLLKLCKVPFCLVPSAEFSTSARSLPRPDHLCRFRGARFPCNEFRDLFLEAWQTSSTSAVQVQLAIRSQHIPPGFA